MQTEAEIIDWLKRCLVDICNECDGYGMEKVPPSKKRIYNIAKGAVDSLIISDVAKTAGEKSLQNMKDKFARVA